MTSYSPVPAEKPLALPEGPKLSYEVGESCWIYAGLTDQAGNATRSQGTVIYWVELPDLAHRLYLVRIAGDFMNVMCRDATVMSTTRDGLSAFQKTRHDNTARAQPLKTWLAS